MRILHVLPGLAPGGMERIVIWLARDAAAHGDSVVVASGPGAWIGEVIAAGAAHVELPATSRRTAFGMAKTTHILARSIGRIQPHLVHSHNVRATALARLALALAHHRAELLPTLHGVSPRDYGAASRILRLAARRVIACAPSVALALEGAGFPGHRIDVITNGAALQAADRRQQEELRHALGLGDEPIVVGIGRLVPQKNWPVFIAAASQIEGPSFVVAGDGPLRQDLVELSRRSGGRVRFIGEVDDVASLVSLASCVVSTSVWEGLPLALLEALSLGAPVVATAVDGIRDVVPRDAVLLVPPDDPSAVSTAVSRVLTDQLLVASLRQHALAAAASWRPEHMLNRYRNAYLAALAAASCSATG